MEKNFVDILAQGINYAIEETERDIDTFLASVREKKLSQGLISMGWVPPNSPNGAPSVQKLIDAIFEIALTISDTNYELYKLSNDGKAEWIAEQLRLLGFDTAPCGASWGVLVKENNVTS